MKFSWPFTTPRIEFLRRGNLIRSNDVEILREFIPIDTKLVLDVGSNDAFWSLMVTRQIKAKVIYLDLNVDALKIAQGRELTVVCADASALPFRSDVFDTVYSVSCYQFVPQIQEAFAEVHRVLKRPGHFCFCVDSFSGKGYDKKSWKAPHSHREGVIHFFSQEFASMLLNKSGYHVEQQFCVLGNGWWRLLKLLYWMGPFQLILWPFLYLLISFAYCSRWKTGHKLFASASKK